MDFTITSIQYVEDVGAIVDVVMDAETILANGIPMGQILKISVPVDAGEHSTVADIQQKARQQTVGLLRKAAEFIGCEG